MTEAARKASVLRRGRAALVLRLGDLVDQGRAGGQLIFLSPRRTTTDPGYRFRQPGAALDGLDGYFPHDEGLGVPGSVAHAREPPPRAHPGRLKGVPGENAVRDPGQRPARRSRGTVADPPGQAVVQVHPRVQRRRGRTPVPGSELTEPELAVLVQDEIERRQTGPAKLLAD